MPTTDDILNALRSIIDPDLNRDIVSLGFVQNIVISDEKVTFDIELTTPACPVKQEFETRARAAVTAALPQIKEVEVRMTSRPPRQSAVPEAIQGSGLNAVRSLIAVSSCKGGVGKSTIAAQIAIELARRGLRTGLVDADIHGPSVPGLFHLQPDGVHVNARNQFLPVEHLGLRMMSFGFLLGDAPAVMRGPMVARYVQQILHQTAWGELDYLIIDMPPGTGDVQLTITQSVRLAGAVIVTTPQTLSLIDVARGILMFEKVDVPILGAVINQAYFLCSACDTRHHLFGNGASALTDRFGIETLGEIPFLPQFAQTITVPTANSFIMDLVDRTVRALGKQSVQEKQVPETSFDEKTITLVWPEGQTITIDHRTLRASCECALCVNEITGKKLLQEDAIRSDIAPVKIMPLGNYAVGIEWNDGHTSGIYPYRRIRELSGNTVSS